MDANSTPTWQPPSALPMMATMVGEMLDTARENYESLSKARARPSMLDDATLDRVERVWGDTAADHGLATAGNTNRSPRPNARPSTASTAK